MAQIDEADFAGELARALSRRYYAELRVRLGAIAEPLPPGELAPPEGRFLVASIDGAPVGCVGLRRLGPGVVEVKHLFVEASLRGQGVGRSLLAAAEHHARRLGADRVVLDTAATLEEATALYRAAGYEEVAPYNDNPHAQLWFEKRLAGGLFAEVREDARFVAARARTVRVDEEALARLAEALPAVGARPAVDDAYFYRGEPEETAAYVLTFTSVNFGSGWHPHLEKAPGRSGSITMMTRLTERFRARGPLSPTELAGATAEMMAGLFGQHLEPPVDELMTHFAEALSALGHLVLERYDGRLVALIEAADHRAERLASLLLEMPMYRDVATYEGREVLLLKRAQIAAAELAAALGDHPLGRFVDLEGSTIFADNLVPHVLRIQGVLVYDHELAARIEAGQLLETGSPEEVEIRACAIWAVEQMVEQLRQRDIVTSAAGLDYLLWHQGQAPRYKAVPRHRCRTVFY